MAISFQEIIKKMAGSECGAMVLEIPFEKSRDVRMSLNFNKIFISVPQIICQNKKQFPNINSS